MNFLPKVRHLVLLYLLLKLKKPNSKQDLNIFVSGLTTCLRLSQIYQINLHFELNSLGCSY